MPYSYNQLIKECLQKTQNLTPMENAISAMQEDLTTLQTLLNSLSKDSNGNYIISIPTKFLDNVTVEGTQTIVKTQEIQSENDYIILREGNPLGLAAGAYSGFKIKNYDGNSNNCLLVVDKDGWARIGDENGTIQKIATIQENPINGALVAYNSTTKQLESQNVNLSNFVKKFDDSVGSVLQDNEIGQYQGETTAILTNGFFYKKTNTIPANTIYIAIYDDIYIGSTKVINKGIYLYNSSATFDVTNNYVCKYSNGGQPMIYYVKNPSVGVSAITYNMESSVIANAIITDINIPSITIDNGTVFNGNELNRSYGTFQQFVNSNGDILFAPYSESDLTHIIDGSNVLSVVISILNGISNVYAPINNPIEIKKSDGSAGGDLKQTDTQPTQTDGSNLTVEFTPSSSAIRENIESGDLLSTIAAKISNWFELLPKYFFFARPSESIASNTAFGLFKIDASVFNIQIAIMGGWQSGTLGQLTLMFIGRYGLTRKIAIIGPNITNAQTEIIAAEYDNSQYIYVKYSSNYNSNCTFIVTGINSNSVTPLNFAIVNENNMVNPISITVNS